LEKKQHEIAEMLCMHEAGHVVNNCMVAGGNNLKAEIGADDYVFKSINMNKTKMNQMYDKVKAETIWAQKNSASLLKGTVNLGMSTKSVDDGLSIIIERKKHFNEL
jgi:hypothetical protein